MLDFAPRSVSIALSRLRHSRRFVCSTLGSSCPLEAWLHSDAVFAPRLVSNALSRQLAPFPLGLVIPAAPLLHLTALLDIYSDHLFPALPSIPSAAPVAVPSPHVLPANAESIQLAAHSVADHPLVVQVLRDGWKRHIPLTTLTNARCRSALFVDHLGTKEAGGDKSLSPLFLDAANEPSISFHDFTEAWPRLRSLIEKHLVLSPDRKAIADAFTAHFSSLTTRLDFAAKFPLYMAYDIHIRTEWVAAPGSFSPAVFQKEIWERIVDKHRDRRASMAVSRPVFPPQRAAFGRSNSYSSRGGQSFRGRAPPRAPLQPVLCYVCGDPSHSGRNCSLSSNGFLVKGANGWRAPGDVNVCFRFNGAFSACSSASCNFSHVCSRCGSADHSAQSHPTA